jgi:hypothetical protein
LEDPEGYSTAGERQRIAKAVAEKELQARTSLTGSFSGIPQCAKAGNVMPSPLAHETELP